MNHIQLNVKLNFQQLLDTIKQLSPKEKMLVSEALMEENTGIPIIHQILVLDRVKNARQNPDRLVSWDKASKKLNS